MADMFPKTQRIVELQLRWLYDNHDHVLLFLHLIITDAVIRMKEHTEQIAMKSISSILIEVAMCTVDKSVHPKEE